MLKSLVNLLGRAFLALAVTLTSTVVVAESCPRTPFWKGAGVIVGIIAGLVCGIATLAFTRPGYWGSRDVTPSSETSPPADFD